MIDITTTRRAAGESTIPDSIMYFLFILCLCSAFLLGYDHKNKFDWIVVIGFAIMLSSTVSTIIDMDRPRSGLIDMDKPNEKIIELRKCLSELRHPLINSKIKKYIKCLLINLNEQSRRNHFTQHHVCFYLYTGCTTGKL